MRKPGTVRRHSLLLPLFVLLLPLGLLAYSHVRIVRLSLAEGHVSVFRPGSEQPARAIGNLPLEHGAVVETADPSTSLRAGGRAEIEFEDGSYARLAPGARLRLTELGLEDNGGRVTHLTLEHGTATFKVNLRGGDRFTVLAPHLLAEPADNTTFRIDLDDAGSARLRVARGRVDVTSAQESYAVLAGQTFDGLGDAYPIRRNPAPDEWDHWNAERDQVQTALLNYSAPSVGGGSFSSWSPYSYYSYTPFGSCNGWAFDPMLRQWVRSRYPFSGGFFGWPAAVGWDPFFSYGSFGCGLAGAWGYPADFFFVHRRFHPGALPAPTTGPGGSGGGGGTTADGTPPRPGPRAEPGPHPTRRSRDRSAEAEREATRPERTSPRRETIRPRPPRPVTPRVQPRPSGPRNVRPPVSRPPSGGSRPHSTSRPSSSSSRPHH
jgi:hypothetical protein